jgi:glycerol-3-phosphate acyltransferase PlsY
MGRVRHINVISRKQSLESTMSMPLIVTLLTLFAYLLGAIPNGLLIGRIKGVDIRKVGSGNIGATNVFRSLGRGWGILTFVLDALKGLIPALVFPLLIARLMGQPLNRDYGILFGIAAIAGHNWPVYLRFKGGKGVATSAGVLIGIAPAAVLIGALCWGIVCALSRYVSLASIAAAVAVPIAGWILYLPQRGPLLPGVLTLLGAVIIVRHRANIKRLRTGTENRFGNKKKAETPSHVN